LKFPSFDKTAVLGNHERPAEKERLLRESAQYVCARAHDDASQTRSPAQSVSPSRVAARRKKTRSLR